MPALKGHTTSPETRAKIGAAHRGKTVSQETRKKISDGLKASGYKHSDSTRRQMSLAKRGNKSHLWKGGVTKEHEFIRRTVEYKIWRDNVFERDNYTCQQCGDRGVKLNAHHIKDFANHPELRFDINNGITLCEDDHKKTDSYKGRNKRKHMEKNGEVTEQSLSDYTDKDGKIKKAEYIDEEGFGVADAENKDKLKKPVPIKENI